MGRMTSPDPVLELHLQADHVTPRHSRSSNLAEVVAVQVGRRRIQVRMVERVEGIHTEPGAQTLAHLETLGERKVRAGKPRGPVGVASEVAVCARAGRW